MKKGAVTFTQLTARLERAIHADVGSRGLDILIYGWLNKFGPCTRSAICMREKADGVPWLTAKEAASFSRYAGYDLTVD